jgi:hypothetical protein
VGQAKNRIHVVPLMAGTEEPTLGAIKRALHELSRAAHGSALRDKGAALREAHEQLCRLALRSGIDPDDAMRLRLAEVELLRERMVLVSTPGSGQTST